jgi:single-stranded-DNA-specific exonuclease
MPLRDENRIIVQRGIRSLTEKKRQGISDITSRLDLGGAGRRVSAHDISWQICPVINAAGRMGSPEKAVALFLEKDDAVRSRLAAEIITMNEERKKTGEESWSIVEKRGRESLGEFGNRLALAYGADIPRGFTGILANRLSNLLKVPAVVVSRAKDSHAQGSLRSPVNFKLHLILEPCADLFLDWGGHDYAAGFSMDTGGGNWELFLERLKSLILNTEAGESADENTIAVDAELPLNYLAPDIFKTIDRFEPYGEENRPLLFLSRGLKVADIGLMGKPEAKHVKLTLEAGKYKWPAKYWNAAEKVNREFSVGDKIDLVFSLGRNYFKGMETPEMTVTDLRRSGSE